MFDCITLTVPAKESALTVVRLTTAGAAAKGNLDFETLEDVKTAVYEACYAMTMQKYAPEKLTLCFAEGEKIHVTIRGEGSLHETDGRMPDLDLCNAVLSTMIPHVKVSVDRKGIREIVLYN